MQKTLTLLLVLVTFAVVVVAGSTGPLASPGAGSAATGDVDEGPGVSDWLVHLTGSWRGLMLMTRGGGTLVFDADFRVDLDTSGKTPEARVLLQSATNGRTQKGTKLENPSPFHQGAFPLEFYRFRAPKPGRQWQVEQSGFLVEGRRSESVISFEDPGGTVSITLMYLDRGRFAINSINSIEGVDFRLLEKTGGAATGVQVIPDLWPDGSLPSDLIASEHDASTAPTWWNQVVGRWRGGLRLETPQANAWFQATYRAEIAKSDGKGRELRVTLVAVEPGSSDDGFSIAPETLGLRNLPAVLYSFPSPSGGAAVVHCSGKTGFEWTGKATGPDEPAFAGQIGKLGRGSVNLFATSAGGVQIAETASNGNMQVKSTVLFNERLNSSPAPDSPDRKRVASDWLVKLEGEWQGRLEGELLSRLLGGAESSTRVDHHGLAKRVRITADTSSSPTRYRLTLLSGSPVELGSFASVERARKWQFRTPFTEGADAWQGRRMVDGLVFDGKRKGESIAVGFEAVGKNGEPAFEIVRRLGERITWRIKLEQRLTRERGSSTPDLWRPVVRPADYIPPKISVDEIDGSAIAEWIHVDPQASGTAFEAMRVFVLLPDGRTPGDMSIRFYCVGGRYGYSDILGNRTPPGFDFRVGDASARGFVGYKPQVNWFELENGALRTTVEYSKIRPGSLSTQYHPLWRAMFDGREDVRVRPMTEASTAIIRGESWKMVARILRSANYFVQGGGNEKG